MNVSNFANQYKRDYARPNLFEVTCPGIDDLKFDCKAAQIPALTVGVVEVPYQNRKIKVPGDRTFQDWTITVINDADFTVRRALVNWQAGIQHVNNGGSDFAPAEFYHATMNLFPLDRQANTMGMVEIQGWPSEIGSIDLSWETSDAVQEYTVTFSVTWSSGL